MDIVVEQPLLEYMNKKKYGAIAIAALAPIGCCADMEEILTRFVKEKDIPVLIKKGYRILQTEPVYVLVQGTTLTFEEHVVLGLKRFFGIADIYVSGISTWKL